MRTRITVLIGALLLASATCLMAQEPTPAAQTTSGTAKPAIQAADIPAPAAPSLGTVDFGFRGTNIDGDSARYYRFKDWREGGFVERFRFERVTEGSLWHAEANNVGYRDQRYFGEYQSIGKIKVDGEWNEIPLYISTDTETLYTVSKPASSRSTTAFRRASSRAPQRWLVSSIGWCRSRPDTTEYGFVQFRLPVARRDLKLSVRTAIVTATTCRV